MTENEERLADLEEELRSGGMNVTDAVVRVIRELRAAYRPQDEFSRRAAALKAAREHIAALPVQKPNDRGYRDNMIGGENLVTQELRIARYLLGKEGELWASGCTRCWGTG